MRWIVLAALLGCDTVVTVDGPEPPPPPAAISRGMVVQPIHGTVVAHDTATATIHVAGTSAMGRELSVQVLADPNNLTSWTTIGTTTATTPTTDPTQFAFALDVIPAKDDASRWPQGGVLRLRVIDDDAAALPYAQSGGEDSVIVLASPTHPPSSWTYLTEKATGSATETQAYYAAIGAPATLDAFLTTYGFGPDDGAIGARYYNAGDLGIGREMHCRRTQSPAGGVACYVRNFGVFGGDPGQAMSELGAGGTPLATVAMVYTPPLTAPNAVRFVVYTGAGALASSAQLDSHGDNTSIPQNCLNCHGGGATYDEKSHTVLGAQFLLFDPAAFAFSSTNGMTLADQEGNFSQLNQLVLLTSPTAATRQLIEGMFPGSYHSEFVPPAWNQNTRDRTMYEQVIAPYCRNCHASQLSSAAGETLQLGTPDQVRARGAMFASQVCADGIRAMPTAQATATKFFASGARAILVGWLGAAGACAAN